MAAGSRRSLPWVIPSSPGEEGDGPAPPPKRKKARKAVPSSSASSSQSRSQTIMIDDNDDDLEEVSSTPHRPEEDLVSLGYMSISQLEYPD
jgi:hypothetical protein